MIAAGSKQTQSNFALVTGMGRSGTSLFSRWMSEIGFDFGSRLDRIVNSNGSEQDSAAAGHVNPTGNFEDAELMKLHVDLYQQNGMSSWLDVPIEFQWDVPPHQHQLFKDCVTKKLSATDKPFAVKNPLATSFLPAWEQAFPDITFILVHRKRAASIDSAVRLRRRNQQNRRNKIAGLINSMKFRFMPSEIVKTQRKALNAWVRCNKEVLDHFSSTESSQTPLVVSSEAWMADNGESVFQQLASRFNGLSFVPVESLLREGFFNHEPPAYGPFPDLEEEAERVAAALSREDICA